MNSNSIEKFKSLLKEIFEFESSDLDFGIYRILNLKRDLIKEYIEKELPEKVESIFKDVVGSISKEAEEKFENARTNLIRSLGKDVLTPSGDVKEEFKKLPIAQEYLKAKEAYEKFSLSEAQKNEVFNDLFRFFLLFYEDGDFMPHYRYSIRKHRYAIPYNGEEIKLYWATCDQYYIKTGNLFRDYTFKAGDYRLIFRTVSAREEIGSNKATKERFFILDDELPYEIENDLRQIIIRFQYRELTEEEVKKYKVEGGSNRSKQEKINELLYSEIINDLQKKVKDFHFVHELEKQKNEKPLLLYHLNRFSAKNTRDYFIHKNIKKFLLDQLDYFVKSEILNLNMLTSKTTLEPNIARAFAFKKIAEEIIDFIAQIEDFQKALWEKKKFVVRTEYVVTLDRLAKWCSSEFFKDLLTKILLNRSQLEEWKKLGFGEVTSESDLIAENTINGVKYKSLPLDTAHFDEEFKEALLQEISNNVNLEEVLDGLLIKSENWQALNLLLAKYREKVQTIYIDPPFNKEQDADYLYNVKYKDSTWATMLENRLRLARDLLSDRGSIFVRCDYNGNWIVRPLMDEIFGKGNFRNEIVLKRGYVPKGMTNQYITGTDSLMFYGKSKERMFFSGAKRKIKEEERQWISLDMPGQRKTYELQVRYFFGKPWLPPKGQHWGLSQEKINEYEEKGWIRINPNRTYIDTQGNIVKGMPEYLKEPELLLDTNWTDIKSYETHNTFFQTENSEILLKRVIEGVSNEGDLVMDFFLGSGTTTAVAHKLKRKWIGVEMGEHFWTVVLPRMKKVLAYDEKGISKEKDVKKIYNKDNAGGFFKYQLIEQYEDVLDNLEIKENETNLFKKESKLDEIKYLFDPQKHKDNTFLNIEHLSRPFDYKLKINFEEVGEPKITKVDIIETFNYLIGLHVQKIWFKIRDGLKYAFVFGKKDEKRTVVIWREWNTKAEEQEYIKDKEFIYENISDLKPEVVYVSANSALVPEEIGGVVEIRYIEPEFKSLMFRASR